jgi:hypothetical protein
MRVEDRIAFITAVGDRWAHMLWGARTVAGRDVMDGSILETWNELNTACRLGHAAFHEALAGRLATVDAGAAAAMERLASELLDRT